MKIENFKRLREICEKANLECAVRIENLNTTWIRYEDIKIKNHQLNKDLANFNLVSLNFVNKKKSVEK